MKVRMTSTVQMKRSHLIGISFIIMLVLYVVFSSLRLGWLSSLHGQSDDAGSSHGSGTLKRGKYSVWPDFSVALDKQPDWFVKNCWPGEKLSVSAVSQVMGRWAEALPLHCSEMYKTFVTIFDVKTLKTKVLIEGPFAKKVKKWLGNNEDLFQEANDQTVIKIYNFYTNEQVLINPLRDKRPIAKPQKPERELFTAQDHFTRLESEHSVSASNTFKWDKWHGLILTKQHHPLNWNEEQFMDLMKTAMKWFEVVQAQDTSFSYPVIIWDLLPHASASQIHPHIHTNLNAERYYGYLENWRSAGELYYHDTSRNYFTDLAGTHKALNLSIQLGEAVAFAHLIPRKDDEVVVMSRLPDEDFFKLIYYTVRAFIEDMEKFCFSLAVALPTMGGDKTGQIPAFARIVTRGSVSSIRSDISSVDLFVASNVNIDPYKVIGYIRNSVAKRYTDTSGASF
ncbi:LOW QUALITY PROTEIN: uncharacterized protein LOC135471048 [Liolophura sinensis]|uniref:LOW QUALITY PROTEIN: uncharacterized protein LOC135471048 n=1 Tax=Liolophura sinensis TaxID=3198878 RepID=UPI003158863A